MLKTDCSLQAQLAQAEDDATDLHQALGALRRQLEDQINLVQQGTQTQNQLQVQLTCFGYYCSLCCIEFNKWVYHLGPVKLL